MIQRDGATDPMVPTREVRAERVSALAGAVRDRGLEAVVFTGAADLRYYTGLHTEAFERLLALVVRADGEATFVVPRLEEAAVWALDPPVDVSVWDGAEEGIALVAAALRPAQRVGVDEVSVSHGRALAFANALGARGLEPAADLLEGVRVCKRAEEQAALRAAADLLTPAIHDALSRALPGSTEIELARWLERRLQDDGSEASHVIVLFGEHSSHPHASPGERTLAEGEVISIDATAAVGGYHADVTRCATSGEPSPWAKETWRAVVTAHAAALDTARPGVTANDVNAAATRHQLACPNAEPMHGVGHGVGLEIHEPPYLVAGGKARMAPGMAITVEPALYHPEHGGLRLESTALVVDGEAAQVITGHDEELRCINPA